MKDDEEKLSKEGLETETHNPPSLVGDSGIHLRLGESGEFCHAPLEEVLSRLASIPMAALGSAVRDISGPIDCKNEMRVSPDDIVLQIEGQTNPENFGRDSYPRGFPGVISEHCQHTVFGAGGSRLINTLKEIVPRLKKEK
jgi:hypothetical protein